MHQVHDLIERCWDAVPKKRPTFVDICVELDSMVPRSTDWYSASEKASEEAREIKCLKANLREAQLNLKQAQKMIDEVMDEGGSVLNQYMVSH